ncbi:unnamed protein product [Somion occarium]|uniref:YCII-related domain-containing protein n=1 Tax=Somion occarium TaxID=3059160 RepID=A0ABP1D9E2_9APHY
MSTASGTKQRFFVYAPDKAGAAENRAKYLDEHRAGIQPLVEKGILKVGAALLEPSSIQAGGEPKFFGSAVFVEAESIDDVRKQIEADTYWVNDVWDKEKLTIFPALLATPLP